MSEDKVALICVAAVLCSFAGCTAVSTAYTTTPRTPEVICADQFWPSEYCKALVAAKAKP